MSQRGVVGIDVGTTTVKVVVIGDDSAVLAESMSSSLNMETDSTGRSEESPTQILDYVANATLEACGKLNGDVELVGLAVASQSGSIAAIDGSRAPTGPLITWMDSRSDRIVDQWLSTTDAEMIRSVSGWNAGTGLGLSTLAWITTQEPDKYPGVVSYVGADTLVTHFLTGRATTNLSNAAAMQLVDMANAGWSPQLCDLGNVSSDLLPELGDSGDVIGGLTTEAATKCGLPAGLPVVAGGHDQTCAAFALDVTEPGHVLLGSGTAWVITAVAEADTYRSIPSRFNVSPHVIPGRITASEYLGGLGAEFEAWVAANHGSATQTPPDRAELFAAVEADIAAGRGAEAIVIMERAADRVRQALEQLATSDTRPAKITLVGGATASRVWPEIIAEATGLPITIRGDNSWPAIGAARLAGIGLGLRKFSDYDQTIPHVQETNP